MRSLAWWGPVESYGFESLIISDVSGESCSHSKSLDLVLLEFFVFKLLDYKLEGHFARLMVFDLYLATLALEAKDPLLAILAG